MDDSVAHLIAENENLKRQNIELKWIVSQCLQRWAKDKFAIFYTVNKKKFGIKIEHMPERKQLHVSIKEIVDAPDTPSRPTLN